MIKYRDRSSAAARVNCDRNDAARVPLARSLIRPLVAATEYPLPRLHRTLKSMSLPGTNSANGCLARSKS